MQYAQKQQVKAREERPIKQQQPTQNPYAPPPKNLNMMPNEHLGIEIAVPGQDKIVMRGKTDPRQKQSDRFGGYEPFQFHQNNPDMPGFDPQFDDQSPPWGAQRNMQEQHQNYKDPMVWDPPEEPPLSMQGKQVQRK